MVTRLGLIVMLVACFGLSPARGAYSLGYSADSCDSLRPQRLILTNDPNNPNNPGQTSFGPSNNFGQSNVGSPNFASPGGNPNFGTGFNNPMRPQGGGFNNPIGPNNQGIFNNPNSPNNPNFVMNSNGPGPDGNHFIILQTCKFFVLKKCFF